MKEFIIEKDFWDVFPNAKIGIVICNNIDNTRLDNYKYQEMLDKAQIEALKHLPNTDFSSNEIIQEWREAFQKFKTKKGARSSIEALLKRTNKGDNLPTINPLVDIYNSISLKYGLPCGSEDIDRIVGNIRLTKANGSESFITLGSDKSEPPYENEIVYKDDEGAICRCWNWREAKRTMITEETKNAFVCLEILDDTKIEVLSKALNELVDIVENNLGGKCKIIYLNSVDNIAEIL